MRIITKKAAPDTLTIELPSRLRARLPRPRGQVARRSVGAALVSQNSIVVLPFLNHSGDADTDAFCKGVGDEVVHRLAQLPGLRVLKAGDNAEAMARTAAALMVGGTVRRSSGRVRVSAHLLDGATGVYLWSEIVDGDLSESFAVQERVAEVVMTKLEPEIGAGPGAFRVTRPGVNLAAQNLPKAGITSTSAPKKV